MSNEITRSKAQEWLDTQVLREGRKDLMVKACGGDETKAAAIQALLARAVIDNQELLRCTPASLFSSMMTAAELGLSPSGHHNGAYFATYRDNKKNITECKLGLGYGAIIELATRDGRVRSFKTEAVWKQDTFEVEAGTDNRIKHVPQYFLREGEPVAYYAIAFFADGGHEFEVMTRAQVERVRAGSRNKDAPPWKYQFDEMGKKTVLRRLGKRLPLTPRIAQALADADAADGYVYGPEHPQESGESRADRMNAGVRKVANTAQGPVDAPESTTSPEAGSESSEGSDAAEGIVEPPARSLDADEFVDSLELKF